MAHPDAQPSLKSPHLLVQGFSIKSSRLMDAWARKQEYPWQEREVGQRFAGKKPTGRCLLSAYVLTFLCA
ncbi:hypothetical protein JMJ77_0005574 [Colletotrichum scovillei]|uniref:Uncharacterized protein n=1 Tax=Colletotrichum scovillei TaxID=1209932 RepID=A0A9P7UM54_9PEZI|nr:hypothetical protein JMJ77_0005574 [Colletotrichum scovillei]KAG7076796.1 hypothetical protein JMJ76_0014055 [Colletotrichum scovillei]KAG7083798.1 hypothetical protein JMJ78_0009240 [Colletotrichum scovillei]